MNITLLESQEGVLYFTSLALSMISAISSVASHSVQNPQTLQRFLSPLYHLHGVPQSPKCPPNHCRQDLDLSDLKEVHLQLVKGHVWLAQYAALEKLREKSVIQAKNEEQQTCLCIKAIQYA